MYEKDKEKLIKKIKRVYKDPSITNDLIKSINETSSKEDIDAINSLLNNVHNKEEIRTKIFTALVTITALILISLCFCAVEIPELTCNKSQNICRLYTKTLITPQYLDAEFKISDIKSVEVEKHHYHGRGGGHTSYTPQIWLKDGTFVDLQFGSRVYQDAEEIVYDMINLENYHKKGNLWASFFDMY